MRGSTHRTKALKFKTRESTNVHNLISVSRYNLVVFAVSPKDCYCHYVSVSIFLETWEG